MRAKACYLAVCSAIDHYSLQNTCNIALTLLHNIEDLPANSNALNHSIRKAYAKDQIRRHSGYIPFGGPSTPRFKCNFLHIFDIYMPYLILNWPIICNNLTIFELNSF